MPWTIPEFEMLRHPRLVRRLGAVRARVHEVVTTLDARVATAPEPVPFAERTGLRYRPARRGTRWGSAHTCAWFHLTGPMPPETDTSTDRGGDLRGEGTAYALLLDIDGEALLHDNDGTVVGMVTSRLTPIERHASARAKTRVALTAQLRQQCVRDGQLSLWLDAGFNGKLLPPYGIARVRRLDLVRVDTAADEAYADLLTVAYASLRAGGQAALYADSLERAFAHAERGDWAATSAALAPVLDGPPDDSLALTGLGHAHLDLAWLWPIRETRRKARRTFRAQLDLLQEHPDAYFGASQPQQFAWIEQDDPALFERIIAAEAAGRLELQGGFWVEPDTNLPSGESLVRQAIHGQRYWESRFGHRVSMCWLPDAFGYSGALPQILRGAGMDRFLTIKLAWNEHTDFPHRSFVWEGIDGTDVLVHMPPEGTYTSSATGLSLGIARDQYPERDLAPIALVLLGTGDGGGGPSEVHLDLARRGAHLRGLPRLTPGTATGFFDELAGHRDRLPRWRGELYLEKHQGTLTTQAAVKAGNRRLEHQLHDLEYLAAQASWSEGARWPGELIDAAWAEVLLHQFHDMLPGSAIGRVHAESRAAYARIGAVLREATDGALAADPGLPPAYVNTTPVHRAGFVAHEGRWWRHEAPPFATTPLVPYADPHPATLGADGDTMWNDRLRVRFAPDGTIVSLVDTRTDREHARGPLGRLVVHRDPWTFFDAWDITEDYPTRPRADLVPVSTNAVRTHTVRDGPRIMRRHEFRHGRSAIRQDVVLVEGEDLVRFETSVDWRERWRMLRAEFEPEAWADEVACEIQFGHICRSTGAATPQERAQFEICAHRWLDVSDARGFGFSLLNDGKYGHRAKDRRISLALLRAPVYPDRTADRGRHTFMYAVHPHEGPLGQSTTTHARHLNAPHVIARVPPAPPAFVVEPAGVLLDTVTLAAAMTTVTPASTTNPAITMSGAQDVAGGSADLILRLYESTGSAGVASITGPAVERVTSARRVTLLLDDLGPADLGCIPVRPFEIVTLRLTRTAR